MPQLYRRDQETFGSCQQKVHNTLRSEAAIEVSRTHLGDILLKEPV